MILEFNAVLNPTATKLSKLKQIKRIHLPILLRKQAISFLYLVMIGHTEVSVEAKESKVKHDHSYVMQPPPYVIFPAYEDDSFNSM